MSDCAKQDRFDVSVIIPTRNRARLIGESIESALAQTLPPVEVIVIDDGSSDNTCEVVRKYGNRVTCIRREARGAPAASNAGIRAARGRYVARLDDDDLWLPDKLEAQSAALRRVPDAALVFGRMESFRPDGSIHEIWPDEALPGCEPAPIASDDQETVYLCGAQFIRTLLLRDLIPHSSVLMRRDVLLELGGYDEAIPCCDDWDLWIRIALAGHRIVYVPHILYRYRLHDDNMSRRMRTLKEMEFRVILKTLQNPALPPEMRRPLRRSAAVHAKVLGDRDLAAGEYRGARRWYATAMAYGFRPVQPVSWALCWTGRPGRRIVRALNPKTEIFS